MIRVIENEKDWNLKLLETDSYDFYHTYEYHHVQKKDGEQPILIAFEEKDVMIAIPFLKRRIDTVYFDLTSVHGYLGPISKNITEDYDNSTFKIQLIELLEKENIVSVFSKLNPYIKNQKKILNALGDIQKIGELIFFDQHLDDETQTAQYKRNTRQKLKQLRQVCTVKHVEGDVGVSNFIKLYHANMDRLEAKAMFYFGKEYFDSLLNSDMMEAKVVLAIHNETKDIMGGVFCVKTKEIVHIELAGTDASYFKESPLRILFDECRAFYKDDVIKYLNLGGGRGGREGSLMKYKATFTQDYIDYNIWKCVINKEAYNALLKDEQRISVSDYFPKYRLNSP